MYCINSIARCLFFSGFFLHCTTIIYSNIIELVEQVATLIAKIVCPSDIIKLAFRDMYALKYYELKINKPLMH